MYDNTSGRSTAVDNGTTNNGVYDDDGDLISGHHVPGTSSRGGSGGSLPNSGDGGGSTWSANTFWPIRRQHDIAQLAQLNVVGMKPFNVNFVRHDESHGDGAYRQRRSSSLRRSPLLEAGWTAGRCRSRRCWTAGFAEMQVGAADRVGPEAAGLKGVNTGRAAHHPRQTAAAARRKTKKISTPSPQMSRDGTARLDCTSTRRTLRVCLRRKW